MGFLFEIVFGRGRCLKNFFTAWMVLFGQIYALYRIASICGTYTKTPISLYNRGSSINGQAYFVMMLPFHFSSIFLSSLVGFCLLFPVY